jgi:thiol:disulfide interchange protein DsbC
MRAIRRLSLAAAVALALPVLAFGAPAPESATDVPKAVADALTKSITGRFPDSKVLNVASTPIPGLYEVFMGDTIIYSNANGDYLILGSMMDAKTRNNMTTDRMNALTSVPFDQLPVAQAIKVVKGNGSRKIAVFSDPDCPFCHQLENTFANVTDVTIYTFLYPIASLHPDAPNKARNIWCAADRSTVWTQWMTQKKAAPAAPATCKNDPVKELQVLGDKLHINSTPTLFFPSGKRVSGALQQPQLEAMLNAPAAPASAKAKS